MYIETNNQRYSCRDYSPGQDTVRYYLSVDAPEELGETIDLCTEDGFVMATQTVEDFLRWEVSGNTLVLTNLPVPEPVPEPTEPGAEEQIAELKRQLQATDYKIIKCSEYQLNGKELPYDVATLHAERQELRDQINELEAGETV